MVDLAQLPYRTLDLNVQEAFKHASWHARKVVWIVGMGRTMPRFDRIKFQIRDSMQPTEERQPYQPQKSIPGLAKRHVGCLARDVRFSFVTLKGIVD
jgi:hypothetical protein